MISIFAEPNCKLKSFKVKLNEFTLETSTIKSIEFAYSNTRPIVKGQIYLQDLNDLNMSIDWSTAIIQVTYIDLLDGMFTRKFHVVDVGEIKEDLSRKSFILDLVDEFSYAFSNSYISRSFNVPLNQAVLEIASDLGVDNVPHVEMDFSSVPYTKPYITSKNTNSLSYFTRELYRQGYTFYQTKTGIHIKSMQDLIPSTLEINGKFSDHPTNQHYMNRIRFHDVLQNNRSGVSPSSTAITYDASTKQNKRITEDPLNSLRLNSRVVDLSNSTTSGEYLQSQLNNDQRQLDLKREYMDQNILIIYVSGYMKNELNQVYDVIIKGNDTFIESQMKGDELLSGKYVSKLIQEKIILDSYVQMITLHRADQMETKDPSDIDDEEFGGSFDDF